MSGSEERQMPVKLLQQGKHEESLVEEDPPSLLETRGAHVVVQNWEI